MLWRWEPGSDSESDVVTLPDGTAADNGLPPANRCVSAPLPPWHDDSSDDDVDVATTVPLPCHDDTMPLPRDDADDSDEEEVIEHDSAGSLDESSDGDDRATTKVHVGELSPERVLALLGGTEVGEMSNQAKHAMSEKRVNHLLRTGGSCRCVKGCTKQFTCSRLLRILKLFWQLPNKPRIHCCGLWDTPRHGANLAVPLLTLTRLQMEERHRGV